MSRAAWLLLLVLAALWGSSYALIEVALEDDLSPVAIVWARVGLGAAVLVALAARRGALAPLRGHGRELTALALVQVIGPFLLITWGQEHIASSLAGILVAAMPIWIALLSLGGADRLSRWGAIGTVTGLVGVGLLFGVDLSGGALEALGGAAVLLAALGYALGSMLVRRRLGGLPPVGVAAGAMLVAAIALLPTVPFSLPPHAPAAGTLLALLVLGAGSTGIAFVIFYTLIGQVGPNRAGVVSYVAPVFAVGYGVTLLGEPLTASTVAGLVLVLAGSYVAISSRPPWTTRTLRARTPATPP